MHTPAICVLCVRLNDELGKIRHSCIGRLWPLLVRHGNPGVRRQASTERRCAFFLLLVGVEIAVACTGALP